MTHSMKRPVSAAAAGLILLTGCGRSADAPQTAGGAKPDVIVTVDGAHRMCSVSLSSEAQGSSVACGDVAAFVRDELRVPGGSRYEVRRGAGAQDADTAKVASDLNGAGYRN